MKRLALIAALMMGVSASCFAQKSTITLNNYDANVAIYLQTGAGAPTLAPVGTALTLWGGDQAVTAPAGGAAGIEIQDPAGFFDLGTGVIPGAAGNANVTFRFSAVVGGQTVYGDSWTQVTGNWNDAAVPPAPATGPTLNLPAGPNGGYVIGIPEPSTIALGLLGAALLVLRRRQ